MDLEDEASLISSRQDLAEFVRRMAAVAASGKTVRWENDSLPRFLEALAAYLADMDGYFRNQGLAVPDHPSWRLIADVLAAATHYE